MRILFTDKLSKMVAHRENLSCWYKIRGNKGYSSDLTIFETEYLFYIPVEAVEKKVVKILEKIYW